MLNFIKGPTSITLDRFQFALRETMVIHTCPRQLGIMSVNGTVANSSLPSQDKLISSLTQEIIINQSKDLPQPPAITSKSVLHEAMVIHTCPHHFAVLVCVCLVEVKILFRLCKQSGNYT